MLLLAAPELRLVEPVQARGLVRILDLFAVALPVRYAEDPVDSTHKADPQ